MKPKVNLGLCIGCGACESMCPKCFQIEEDGKSHIKKSCSPGCCNFQDLVDVCPVAAITVEK